MVTVGTDGRPKTAKMEPAVLDDQLLSVGHRHKVRTRRLGRDPRATLYFDGPGPTWLALDATVEILDDENTPAHIVAFMRHRLRQPDGPLPWHGDNHVEVHLDDRDFMDTMTTEGAVLYRFSIDKTYGNLPATTKGQTDAGDDEPERGTFERPHERTDGEAPQLGEPKLD